MSTKHMNIKIDSETHRALKIAATQQDMSIQAYLIHLIKQAVYHTVET